MAEPRPGGAGPGHRARGSGVPFGLHARQSLAAPLRRDADEILAVTRACFDRYREIFAEPYPYDSYDQAFVPELESGAVENPGCVTFRDDFLFPSAVTRTERQLRAMVIAHEMAHMWFGDLVTMRWWNDVWLSESFATYMGFQVLAEATGFTGAWTDFALARKARGYDADQRASAHPVAPEPRDVPDTDAARSGYDDRAALPDDAAKRAAWAAMLSGRLSGYELTATAQGFWQADQAELLAGYVPRYFFALAEAAAGGEAGLARAWCMHGFPHHAADTATVQAGERCLETGAMGQGSGSLRRLLADQVEDLRRSAAVRSAY